MATVNIINEAHTHNDGPDGITLTFAKSLNVQAFPCGRRRSELVETADPKDKYYIPFDPEARLNTEVNNRRHASINGFTNSFVQGFDVDKACLNFVLAGYSFSVTGLTDGLAQFCSSIINRIGSTAQNSTKIYANIKLEETPLYKNETEGMAYDTWVLRNQSPTQQALLTLDIARTGTGVDVRNVDDYYFSGLSFSVAPITEDDTTTVSTKFLEENHNNKGNPAQQEFSICILQRETTTSEWKIYEAAKLPRVEHGATEDSIEVGHLNAQSIKCKEHPVAVFDVKNVPTKDPVPVVVKQLHIYNAE